MIELKFKKKKKRIRGSLAKTQFCFKSRLGVYVTSFQRFKVDKSLHVLQNRAFRILYNKALREYRVKMIVNISNS